MTVETCYHYLHFESESIPDGATEYKCCPPIRNAHNRELLWQALLDGTIDYVVSDHSPCTPNLKLSGTGDFMHAWGGIASVQFGLNIMWQECMHRQVPTHRIIEWLCWRPAERVNLSLVKGRLQVGAHADFCVFEQMVVDRSIRVQDVKFKNKVSPYVARK